MKPLYTTAKGKIFVGDSIEVLTSDVFLKYKNKIQLIFTSPPFPLNRKKSYGNLNGEQYITWLENFATIFNNLLKDNGSVIIELGNAWLKGLPAQSTIALEALLNFKKKGNFFLCQEFIYYNNSRLPTPVQWVNIDRIRVKDAFTRLWWLSKTPYPYADNRNVLVEYSDSMKRLILTKKYNSGKRPSEHLIGKNSFAKNNGGAIPPNVIIAPNTSTNDNYLKYCKVNGWKVHPARMPTAIPEFFIKLLTKSNQYVLDPFAGSNVTGHTAENLKRRWLSVELQEEFAQGSIGRFDKPQKASL